MKKFLFVAALASLGLVTLAADAKKPAPKKAVKGFEPYAAGEWKPLDNKKNHLYGIKLREGDLVNQPVMIVKFDPSVLFTAEDREKDPTKFISSWSAEQEVLPPRYQVINVPTRALTADELAKIEKNDGKFIHGVGAVQDAPWYADFGLVKEPENPKKANPFYYVVSIEGKVVYEGEGGPSAMSAVTRNVSKQEKCDDLLGYVKPNHHAAIVEGLSFGKAGLVPKVVQKLTPIAAAKADSEEKTEAKAILSALEQSQTYWEKTIQSFIHKNPLRAAIMEQQAEKSFPRDKARLTPLKTKIMANPIVSKLKKQYEKLMALKEKLPEKKADIQKAYLLVCVAEKACIKARKEFGDNLPAAYMRLEEMVLTLKADLEAAGATPAKK